MSTNRLSYRVWCSNKGEWERDPVTMGENGILMQWVEQTRTFMPCRSENHPVMQSTGLEDERGKEIFEGDIIKDSMYQSEVFFSHGSFMVWIGSGMYLELSQMGNEWEIIGNIHENPELSICDKP